MPRNYVRKGTSAQWSTEQLSAALDAVKSGMKIRAAATRYGIPSSTLHDHVSGKHTRIGRGAPCILTPEEEKEVVTICQVMQKLAFPLTRELMTVALRDYLRVSGRGERLRDHRPGPDWWLGFLKRNSDLVERKPEHFLQSRAAGANPEVKLIKIIFKCPMYLDHQHLVHQTEGIGSRAQH